MMKMFRNRRLNKLILSLMLAMSAGFIARVFIDNILTMIIGLIISVPIILFLARFIRDASLFGRRRVREWQNEFGVNQNNRDLTRPTYRRHDDVNLDEWP